MQHDLLGRMRQHGPGHIVPACKERGQQAVTQAVTHAVTQAVTQAVTFLGGKLAVSHSEQQSLSMQQLPLGISQLQLGVCQWFLSVQQVAL